MLSIKYKNKSDKESTTPATPGRVHPSFKRRGKYYERIEFQNYNSNAFTEPLGKTFFRSLRLMAIFFRPPPFFHISSFTP
jgi:hypothetical protein